MIKEKKFEELVVDRQKRAIKLAINDAGFLAQHAAKDISLRIGAINRSFRRCVDIYSLSNSVFETLTGLENVSGVTRFERGPIAQILDGKFKNTVLPAGDDRIAQVCKDADLVVSAFGLHRHENLSGLLSVVCEVMKSDGLLLMALPARDTLFELRDSLTKAELEICQGATLRTDQFVDLQQAGSLLQTAGFKLPVVDQEQITVRYDDMYALIADLRAMGATYIRNVEERSNYQSQLFKRANELYAQDYSDRDGRVRATFCIAYLTGWSPHESQQKPLKPGSAKISLSRHLGS